MKFWIGVTDNGWFNYLSQQKREDVNFWQPGGNTPFKILEFSAPFLFKLKSPINKIAGVGFFSSHTTLPLNMAWEVFGERNGFERFSDFKRTILDYRRDKADPNPSIGCIVLTNPIFFKKEDWLPVPEDWSNSIVQGKSYSIQTETGNALWERIQILINSYLNFIPAEENSQFIVEEPITPLYGTSILKKVRLGQGAFRVLVTDAYKRKCSVSGEKTLPVLEAAHIKPYSEAGPHNISNALLLRSDLHKLFDSGYITITKEHKVEVSKRIREEYENGKDYYKYHGQELFILPDRIIDKPGEDYVIWHNENIFKG